MTGEARIDTCKDRVAEREHVRERGELELSEVQWM